jgi:hypothetical protein
VIILFLSIITDGSGYVRKPPRVESIPFPVLLIFFIDHARIQILYQYPI